MTKYASVDEERKILVDALVSNPYDDRPFEQLCVSLRPYMRKVCFEKENVVSYMNAEDYMLEFQIAVWKVIMRFRLAPEVYYSVKENDKVIAYIFKSIRNKRRHIYHEYVKKNAILKNSWEIYRNNDCFSNRYIVLEKTIEYWKQKHRDYNHANDEERKAYYQAHREHYKDYNHNYYMAHRDEIRRRQAKRRRRIKLEKELRYELLCRLVTVLSKLWSRSPNI